jgi:beta-lactamase regulating signal transducer with metallopeptidase domain
VTGALAEVGLSNLAFSLALAGLAYAIHRSGRDPGIAHLIWVLVLVKAVTPAPVLLPLLPAAGSTPMGAEAGAHLGIATTTGSLLPLTSADASAGPALDPATAFVLVWVVGSALVLVASLLRIRRFDRLLRRTSAPAPAWVVAVATGIARELGLRSVPVIDLSSARISPMTWWAGRRVRIVIPRMLAEGIPTDDLRLVLAHELAHVRRRDHFIRWLEWIARVVAWWNPVVWWAQRRLREAEELSCDALVLDRLDAGPRRYAGALLAAIELLVGPGAWQPALATGMGAASTLERRFHRIVTGEHDLRAPTWLRAGLAVATVGLLMLGVGTTAHRDGAVMGAPVVAGASGIGDAVADDRSFVSATLPASLPSVRQRRRDADPDRRMGLVRTIGTPAADRLTGTRGRDLIDGRAGPDVLSGRGGDDRIIGGPGRDTIDAGHSDDVVITWQDGRRDAVDCGGGDGDLAVADPSDVLVDCELVERRSPRA